VCVFLENVKTDVRVSFPGIIKVDSGTCDIPAQVANFFGGSCVPGIEIATYPKLCSLCKGDGEANCTSKSEPYRGYGGALE